MEKLTLNLIRLTLINFYPQITNYKNIPEKDYGKQLSLQIHSPVMWSDTIKTISDDEIDTFTEIDQKTLLNFLPKDFQGEKFSFCCIEDIINV